MIENFDLLVQTVRAEAIAFKLYPNLESMWRYYCRLYSQKFYTPLLQVLELDPEHVLLNVMESNMDDKDVVEQIEEMMDKIYSIEDPEYDAKLRNEQDDFDRRAEEEEEDRQRLGKPLHKSLAGSPFEKKVLKKEPEQVKETPSQGFIDLSYLDKEEQ